VESDTVKVAWPWVFVVADPVDVGTIRELPLPWVSEMSFLAIGWGLAPWSSRVTVTVVLPPWATDVSRAEMDELDAEAAGAAKVTPAVCVTVTLSVVSVAV
jgi:hypothetical protein